MTVVDVAKKSYVDAQAKKFGLPVVIDNTDRATQFPVPLLDQRVFNKATYSIERWSGSAWITDFDGRLAFNVRRFGVFVDGVGDDTAGIMAAIAAAPAGHRIIMPPGTYKITSDVILSKVGQQLIMTGATINSVAGRLVAGAAQTMIDGRRNSTFSFLNGSPAASLNQAIVAAGSYNGSFLPISGGILAGAMSFTATNAGDLAGVAAGDWFIVGERTTDWQRQEWKQILSIVGTTVNVTSPFRQNINTYNVGFYKVTPLEDVTVRGLLVKTVGVVDANIGVYPQLTRNFKLENCRFDIAKGMPFAVYMADKPTVIENLVDRQSTQNAAISAAYDGYVARNKFLSKDGMPLISGLLAETGTSWTTFEKNVVVGAGGAGALAGSWIDYNKFTGNTIISDGASHGLYVFGGDGNESIGNIFHKVLDGVVFATNPGPAPARSSVGNTSIGDKVRNATVGFNTNGTRNSVVLLDVDASVITPVVDGGVNTAVMYADPTTGFIVLTPSSLPAQISLSGVATSITQLKLGTSSVVGSVGTRWSGGDTVLAQNAVQNIGADSWHQSDATKASKLLILRLNGDMEFYHAAIGTADGTFAAFWGTAQGAFTAAGRLKLGGTQILGPRVTGYAAMTGAPNKATVYDTATITLAQLAGRVMQLQADFTGHGAIGP